MNILIFLLINSKESRFLTFPFFFFNFSFHSFTLPLAHILYFSVSIMSSSDSEEDQTFSLFSSIPKTEMTNETTSKNGESEQKTVVEKKIAENNFMRTFEDLGLNEWIIKSADEVGIRKPTPVQVHFPLFYADPPMSRRTASHLFWKERMWLVLLKQVVVKQLLLLFLFFRTSQSTLTESMPSSSLQQENLPFKSKNNLMRSVVESWFELVCW